MAASNTKEGEVIFDVPSAGKTCKTWYKIFGDLKNSSTGRPLMILHGGPGSCHNYLLPLQDLANQYGIALVFYDQLGNGHSTHLREKRLDDAFWTPQLFMDEFENLTKELGIKEYDILGQSWGGMLGSMIGISRPAGLKRLIISNSPASMVLWVEACRRLRDTLPRDVDDILERCEREKDFENPKYEESVMEFYKRFLCRIDPFPVDLQDSLNHMKEDDTVYLTMNGPSEFTVIGSLKTWSVIDEVHKINVPTLLINGEYDEAQDSAVAPFFDGIPKVKWVVMANASHSSHMEAREKYMRLVAEFLGAA